MRPSSRRRRWPSFRFAPRPFERSYREKISLGSGERETNRAPSASTAACPIWISLLPNSPGLSREKYLRGPRPGSNKSFLAARAAGSQEEVRSEEHTSELQSRLHLVCRLLLEKKKNAMRYRRVPFTHQRLPVEVLTRDQRG